LPNNGTCPDPVIVGAMGDASEVAVRAARIEDAEAIGRIHVEAWRRTYAGHMDAGFLARMDPARRAEQWRTFVLGPPRVAVAERAGVISGFVSYGDHQDDDLPASIGQVYAIYVDPALQGTGVGAALMNHAVADLAASRYDAAVLWVLAANVVARSFYARGGWRPDGVERVETLGGALLHEVRYLRALP
jgi:ribosomal protein S18 acetylase RimI-like enzyme